jgi:Hypothetical protein (DUF2513)
MKRDWNIIRAILLNLEASPTPNAALNAKKLVPFDEQAAAYNMRLLSEGGYIQAIIRESMTGDGQIAVAIARSLTSAGHELLDTIRSESVWAKIQDKVRKEGLDMTIDVVLLLGRKIVESMLS